MPNTSLACREPGAIEAEPIDPAKPFIWLGTTDDTGAFREIAPNESLFAVTGVQGGSHIWGAARLYTVDGGDWTLQFALRDSQGAEFGGNRPLVEACAGDVIEVTYVRVFLDVSGPIEGLFSVSAVPTANANESAIVSEAVPIKVQ